MAVDYFLKIDGIDGESEDSKHKNEIELLAWSFGESNSGSAAFGSGGGSGKVNMQDFNFTMRMCKATPKLFQSCANGASINKATLTCRKAGGKEPQEYLKIDFTEVLVSSYQTGGSAGDEIPMESISLNFAKVEYAYCPQKPDGTLDGPIKAGYDLKKNKNV